MALTTVGNQHTSGVSAQINSSFWQQAQCLNDMQMLHNIQLELSTPYTEAMPFNHMHNTDSCHSSWPSHNNSLAVSHVQSGSQKQCSLYALLFAHSDSHCSSFFCKSSVRALSVKAMPTRAEPVQWIQPLCLAGSPKS
jgi:hypothetical protein